MPVHLFSKEMFKCKQSWLLWLAVRDIAFDDVERLIEKGADINAAPISGDYAGVSALLLAVIHNQWRLVTYLIKNGADIYLSPKEGLYKNVTVLGSLAFYNKLNKFELILKKHDVNMIISSSSLMQYKATAKKIVEYRATAPFISSLYSQEYIISSSHAFAPTEQIMMWVARRIFSHICDDEHATLYKATGFRQQPMCWYLINICIFCKKYSDSPIITDIFNTVEKQLRVIENSNKYEDMDSKIKNFFTSKIEQKIIIPCHTLRHIMIAKLERKSTGFFLSIYNDGEGINNHKNFIDANNQGVSKKAFANSIAYKLPDDINEKWYKKIIELLSPQITIKTDEFYSRLKTTIASIGATEVCDGLHPSTGQRSGTCSYKSILALLQDSISREQYLLYKFVMKVTVLNEYYNFVKTSNQLLDDDTITEQIVGVCENIERLAQKVLNQPALSCNEEIKSLTQKHIHHVQDIKQKTQDYSEPLKKIRLSPS